MRFKAIDLVCPIGVCLVATTLCGWAAVKADATVAKAIAATVGVLFLSVIPLWFWVRGIPSFTTMYGIDVYQGKKNRPTRDKIDKWTAAVLMHWRKAWLDPKLQPVLNTITLGKLSMSGSAVFFVDGYKLSSFGRFVRGYTRGRDMVIGYREGDEHYTELLFLHEGSHVLLNKIGYKPGDEAAHHKLFRETGLGA